MSLDIEALLGAMLGAAKSVLSDKWPELKDYTETELRGIAEGIALIATLHADGSITEEQARILLEMKKNTARNVMLTIEGLGVLAAEQAINAALGVVRDTVNTALRFPLL
jgi:hypothetical protein